jgi:hypothetical protein
MAKYHLKIGEDFEFLVEGNEEFIEKEKNIFFEKMKEINNEK